MTTESIFSESAPQIKALDRNLNAFSTLFAPGKSWDNVRSTAAPYTESRLTRSFANERVGFPVVEHLFTSFAGFWYPAKKHLYFISVSGAFSGISLPPTPNWSRFDLFIDVYSISFFYCISSYTLYFIIFFFFFLLAISFFESKVVICLCSAYAYAVFMLIDFALLGRKPKYIKSKTTAQLTEKRTSIAAVRDIL